MRTRYAAPYRAAAPHRTAHTPPAFEPPRAARTTHHLLALLLARHGWTGKRLTDALGVSEHAAAEILAHARRTAAEHGRRSPER